jgi:hypothetical protein
MDILLLFVEEDGDISFMEIKFREKNKTWSPDCAWCVLYVSRLQAWLFGYTFIRNLTFFTRVLAPMSLHLSLHNYRTPTQCPQSFASRCFGVTRLARCQTQEALLQ